MEKTAIFTIYDCRLQLGNATYTIAIDSHGEAWVNPYQWPWGKEAGTLAMFAGCLAQTSGQCILTPVEWMQQCAVSDQVTVFDINRLTTFDGMIEELEKKISGKPGIKQGCKLILPLYYDELVRIS